MSTYLSPVFGSSMSESTCSLLISSFTHKSAMERLILVIFSEVKVGNKLRFWCRSIAVLFEMYVQWFWMDKLHPVPLLTLTKTWGKRERGLAIQYCWAEKGDLRVVIYLLIPPKTNWYNWKCKHFSDDKIVFLIEKWAILAGPFL